MDTVEIPKEWLKTLSELAKQVENDLDLYMLDIDKLPPTSIHKLIGYASSAETLQKELK